jgi:hypothetical protein
MVKVMQRNADYEANPLSRDYDYSVMGGPPCFDHPDRLLGDKELFLTTVSNKTVAMFA